MFSDEYRAGINGVDFRIPNGIVDTIQNTLKLVALIVQKGCHTICEFGSFNFRSMLSADSGHHVREDVFLP